MKYRSAALLSAFFLLFCLKPYVGREGEGAVTRKPTAPADQSERRSKGKAKAPVKTGEKVQAGQGQGAAKPKPGSPCPDLSRSGRGKTPIIRSTLRAKG
jgi:hypothetical protein